MAPSPQETMVNQKENVSDTQEVPKPLTGDEVVISGMSGIFPKSDSVLEFKDNLFNKVDMVTFEESRWNFSHPEVPKHQGKVNGMGKFDAQFFRVHFKQACTMEPMSRKLLEHAYSAIYDSGINPLQLRGQKVGVFIGSTFSESEKAVIYENVQRNGFGITGCNRAMYANRISYWIDGKGPSYALDVACASSMACLEHAYRSISTGQCDAAIVGGCNLCIHPNVSLQCSRAGFLCLDGKTKCFDKNGDGFVRSDAISVLFLQKAKFAKRIYSEVYYAKSKYSTSLNEEFLPIREPKEIQEFLEEFYSEIGVSPKDVEYVEANGAAIAEADGNELEAIAKVFAKEKPINIGSVKSNMGSSQPASGVCALTKVCLAYHQGKIPANLHYNEPLDIPSVRDGRVHVLTENVPFNRGFTAFNSFSYSGANVHVLLKGHYKQKDPERYKTSIPYLLLASGRQDFCVKSIFETMNNSPIDPEQIGLMHSIHENDIPGHMCRGYSILETNEKKETVCVSQSVEYCPGSTRPLWFVYSGMGSQWAGMGAELMRIPIFAAAIEKCHKVLAPRGIDIVKILTDPDKTIYDNILHSFVGIAAVQIGLTDILREMGIVPDNIIGHSVGELGCAYADGCFTAEEMILSAYSRGLVSIQTPFIRGSMAAIGLGYKAILALCPPEIEVACHNSAESSTISGPADIMKQFVTELTSRGIFAKEVPCSNIAFHSRYIADAGPGLLNYLNEVIKEPKLRSKKWVSTSVPQENWEDPQAKYSSAEYHTNNLLNSVLFEETSKLIPSNALVIEIAPHGLLQAFLKRSLTECVHIPLTRRGHADPVKFLLESIGKLYQAGVNPKVDALYPKIEFPVATETPMLSHLVEWEHSEDWPQAKYNTRDRVMATIREFVMSIHDDDYKYIADHVRDEVCVFPEAGLLVLVWETLAMHKGIEYKDLPVIFRDVKFHGEATVRTEVPLRLGIMINKGNNKFEVSYENTAIVSGFVEAALPANFIPRKVNQSPGDNNDVMLNAKDIYTMMKLRGYSYKDNFQTIRSFNASRNKASIKWSDNWIQFLDALIQLNAFTRNQDSVSVPIVIKKISINSEEHKIAEQVTIDGVTCLDAKVYDIYDYTKCGGVELDGIIFNDKPIKEREPDVLRTRAFVPHFLTGNIDLNTALEVNFQIIANNIIENKIKVTELITTENQFISEAIKKLIDEEPIADFIINSIPTENIDNVIKKTGESNVVVIDNLLGDEKKMNQLHNVLTKNSFVLTLEENTTKIDSKNNLFNIISVMSVQKQVLILLNKADFNDEKVAYLRITFDTTFSWVSNLQNKLEKNEKVVLISERQPYCGLLGLVKQMRHKYANRISMILVDDFYYLPSFNPENVIFKEQLQKNLTFNVMKKGQWGGYYYLSATASTNFQNVYLTSSIHGNLDNLLWAEAPLTPASNTLVQVCYASPSYKDAQTAVGNINMSKEKAFGMDFSGINKNGERVMGVVSGGALSTAVEADPDLLWPVPDHWSLEDAATVPLPYLQAYYCLAIKTQLYKGRRVFVNGGAGALGQAVISVCLDLECDVFTIVSDVSKKEFLLKMFPQLKEDNIGNSQSTMFQDIVLVNTKGERCDIVINCTSGALRTAAMNCAAMNSLYFDLSDCTMNVNENFGMSYMDDLRNYYCVKLSSIFRPEYANEKKMLQAMISEGIAKGTVRPLSRVIYTPAEVSRAFRLLSTSKHRGKVLLRMKDPENTNQSIKVMPRMTYSSKGSYIVVCDESPLSIELVDRMVKRGARNFVAHIEPNAIAGYCFTKLVTWRKLNTTIKISSENLQTENGCMNLLKEAKKLGPILGIFMVHNFNSVVGEESLAPQQVAAKFNKLACVVANLDLTSRNTCNELQQFVVINYSSQSASDEYVASVIDKICQSRNEITLPALVFRIGLLKELNPEADNIQSKIQPQSLSGVFDALESSMKMKHKNVVTYNLKDTAANNFIDRISRIIGVKNINEVNEEYTLKELIANEINVQEIITAIRDKYKISYPAEKVKRMTIQCIKNLDRDILKPNSHFESGLGAFFTFIDDDECLATEPLITMCTQFSSIKEEEELDPKATYLLLIPGFEGHHQIFTSVCERLKVPAMSFQLGPDLINDSIQQMASNIMKFLKKRFGLKSKFYLLGYSFGVNVALELAALFEKEGHVGIVYCLDSSPDAVRVQLDAYVGNLTDSQLQNSIVQHMYRLMTGKDSDDLRIDLERNEDWQGKIEACVNRLRGLVNYSNQYKRSVIQEAYRRILLAREYEPNFKLQSELVLIKGLPHPEAEGLASDYNLSKYTTRPVKVFNIESDHALAPHDCRVANIVNRLLEPKLLEEYKKKNLCESYLADPFKIL